MRERVLLLPVPLCVSVRVLELIGTHKKGFRNSLFVFGRVLSLPQ